MTVATFTDLDAGRPGQSMLEWLETRRSVPLLLIVCAHAAAFLALRGDPASQTETSKPKEVLAAFMVAAPAPPVLPQPAPKPPPPMVEKPAEPTPVVKPKIKPKPKQKSAITPPAPAEPELTEVAPAPEPVTAAVAPPTAPSVPALPSGEMSAAPAAAPVSTQPKTVSGVEYLQAPQPDYPLISKRMGEEGKVVLRVLVNQRGRAERVDVQRSSGSARLDQAAQQAGMRAVFRPHTENGRPVAVYALVPINFSLN